MKKLPLILGLLLLFMLPAAPAQAVLVSCFDYSRKDGFEGVSASNWVPWNVSNTGAISLGVTASSRTGSKAALFSFSHSEPVGSNFLLIDKVFDVSQFTSVVRIPHHGCADTAPNPPVGQPKYCSASVWVKPADQGATGSLQLLDAATYTYITVKPFSFVGAGAWTQVVTDESTACTRTMVVRIVLGRSTSTSTAMVVDDVRVDWNYL